MKGKIALLLLLIPMWIQAQDSAQMVVNRYLELLNYEALPKDSMLVMETTITFRESLDTFTMHRYFQSPGMMRVEVWYGDSLTEAFCTNGSTRHRIYSPSQEWWDDYPHEEFHSRIQPYDFRGPLYAWKGFDIKLTWLGMSNVDGHRLQTVKTEQKDHYNRIYFFDPQSGLLVLIMEEDAMPEGSYKSPLAEPPIDFKFIHEYMPVGASLIPSQESYRRKGDLTIMQTVFSLKPRNDLLFNQD